MHSRPGNGRADGQAVLGPDPTLGLEELLDWIRDEKVFGCERSTTVDG